MAERPVLLRRPGTFSRADFTYDKERDLYICPGSKTLKTTGRVHDGKTLLAPAIRSCAIR